MKTILLVVTVAAFFSACSDFGEHKDVYVTVNPSTLTITNSIPEPIYYFVIGQRASAYTDWVQSCNESNRIGTNQTRILGYSGGYTAGESILLVYWWKGRPNEGGALEPTELRYIKVQIR